MTGSQTLQSKISHWAKIQGSKIAIIEADTDRNLTYQELLSATIALKNYLGSEPKTILVAIPGGIPDAVIWLTCLTSGHLMIPVSPESTDYEIKQIIETDRPDLIIDKKLLPKIETVIKDSLNLSEALSLPQDGKILLRTSGSTGTPKELILSASQIILTADNIRKSHKITGDDRGLTPLAFYHVNAPVVSLMTTILSGSTLIIAPKYSTSHFWEWVKEYDPTWISLIPTMIAMLLNTERPAFLDQANLRFIRTASEPLPVENFKRFETKFKIPVIETYGLSEAASTVAANPVPPGKHKSGSVGFPLGVKLRICQVNGDKVLPQGEIGEVCLKGENIIKSYEHDRSSESFASGWFKTGDLGFIDEEGYLHLTGRIKDIIIRGGENIAPREIEEVLLSFPGVREVTVVGQPDPIYGERVVAFIVLHKAKAEDMLSKIKYYAASKLAPQKMPEEIILLSDLPRNKTGKVDKRLLKNSWQSGLNGLA